MLVFGQVAGGFGLSVQRVQGDDGTDEIQVRDRRGQFRDLVGLGVDFPLGTHAPRGYVQHGQQADLAAISADRAADRLAVRGGLLQQAGRPWPGGRRGGAALLTLVPGHGRGNRRAGGPRGEVPVQHRVERRGVDVLEDPGEGTDARRADPPGPRVAPPARTASVSSALPAAHSATAAGESCPAAVTAQIARASTNSSGCHRPSRDRGSGTRASHARRQQQGR